MLKRVKKEIQEITQKVLCTVGDTKNVKTKAKKLPIKR